MLPLACTGRPQGETASESATTGTTTATATMSATETPTTGQPQPSTATSTGTDATTSPATESTTGDATTSMTSESTSGTDATASTDATSDASSTTLAPADSDCDIWAQNCPEGQKCMPVSLDDVDGNEAAQCRPVVADPDGVGEPCTVLGKSSEGLDTCPEGHFCWRDDWASQLGTCLALCIGSPGDPSCPGPDLVCELDPSGVENLCVRHCDPLAPDCPGDDLCVPDHVGDPEAGHFMCIHDASGDEGQVFDPCTKINTCDQGLHCGSAFMIPECGGDPEKLCCMPYCDLTVEPDVCPGVGEECFKWHQGVTPPGLEEVGLCGVPPR